MKLKQIIYNLRRQPVISSVSIIGTALAIFLIMIVVFLEQVQIVPFAPESNRDRWLINKFMSITNDNWPGNGGSNGPMSYTTFKEVYLRMETPEEVTCKEYGASAISVSAVGVPASKAYRLATDHRFWNVMDFTFIEGKPFDAADFEAGIPAAVVTQSIAKKIFGTTDVIGRQININYEPFTIKGVVKDVSPLATNSYAQIWIPFSSLGSSYFQSWCDDIMGPFTAIILAKDKSDFPAIRDEFKRLHEAYFGGLKEAGWNYIQRERPYDQYTNIYTPWANWDPDIKSVRRQRLIMFAILLIVPAINLSSMTHSRMRRQREEIGIRRAFGASRLNIIRSLFTESFIITLIAGLIGLILAVVFSLSASRSLFAEQIPDIMGVSSVNLSMLIQWSTFGIALFFCLLLNIICAALPAIQASRVNIVNAISKK